MGLPILEHPTFELTIPSTHKPLTYRPFLVKEEKVLLLAQESDEMKDLTRAIKQVLKNCIIEGEIDLEDAPTFDIEYMFLQLRANSVSNKSKFNLNDPESKKPIEVELDLKEVNVKYNDDHNSLIKLNDKVSLQMKYPTYETISLFDNMDSLVDTTFGMIKYCVDKVLVGEEEVHELKDYSDKEINEFIDSLTTENFEQVQAFFDTMPRLEHTIEYKVGKKTKTRTFVGLSDFFSYA